MEVSTIRTFADISQSCFVACTAVRTYNCNKMQLCRLNRFVIHKFLLTRKNLTPYRGRVKVVSAIILINVYGHSYGIGG